jgi:hypothetical protein
MEDNDNLCEICHQRPAVDLINLEIDSRPVAMCAECLAEIAWVIEDEITEAEFIRRGLT